MNYPSNEDLRKQNDQQAARIAELEVALEQSRKDAQFMANIWKQHKRDFAEIVNDYNGDADGVDFVARRILKGGTR